MTHKEKAKELVNKFKFDCRIEYECRPLSVKQISKQCALIAVDFAIDNNPVSADTFSYQHELFKVKQEIEKL